ncbi:class I SAM-dependent DNA methyltransferase [Thalassococcus lentus]|uniref:Class I SAM-dependent methyltransferase n=1 Tax=Thalassococcus lentus TaxID=1210524 RepID=A0ABT4XP29_9RHOB|nr:class I SAM-dependent methyltransferase [Thalassococcus lentus]MDA7423708.1 class I SAM-dependent methyltransferase [Thalassococcus lentus]
MTDTPIDPTLPEQTRAVYERNATGYDRRRNRALFEAQWLRRFVRDLVPGASVLDLGCGSGEPIAAWLIGEGFRLTGFDYSDAMLDIARSRWPEGDWRQGDMRVLELPERFDGIIGWNSFFHLTDDEQRACLPRLAAHLNPGGVLMVTVGPSAGEVTGTVEGEVVYHASLSPAEYAQRLEACGMRVTGFLADDPDCAGHSVLMASKEM